jgi:hypothetical protein
MQQKRTRHTGLAIWLLTGFLAGSLFFVPALSTATSTVASPVASVKKAEATSTETPSPTASVGPRAVVQERTFTFAPVPEGTDVHHVFVIENHGTAPLVIKDIKTG